MVEVLSQTFFLPIIGHMIKNENTKKDKFHFLSGDLNIIKANFAQTKTTQSLTFFQIMLECWKTDPYKRPTFEFLAHMFEDFNITSQPQYME